MSSRQKKKSARTPSPGGRRGEGFEPLAPWAYPSHGLGYTLFSPLCPIVEFCYRTVETWEQRGLRRRLIASASYLPERRFRPDRIDRVLTARARLDLVGGAIGMVTFGVLAWAAGFISALVVSAWALRRLDCL